MIGLRRRTRLSAGYAIVAAILLLVGATQAKADTIFTLSLDECTGGCGSAPFGTVTLKALDANTVKVLLQLKAGELFVKTGAGEALEFNIAGDVTIGNLTPGFAIASLGKNKKKSEYTASAFGEFPYAVTCTTCGGGQEDNPAGPLDFTVTAPGLTEDSFIANAGGFYFASDILGTNGHTGNVGVRGPGQPSTVPEPASLLLLGTGLVGVGHFVRKRRA